MSAADEKTSRRSGRGIVCSDDLPLRAELADPYGRLPPLRSTEAVLEVRGVHAVYGDKEVLHNIFCHFPEKRVTAIMGPSGCGKSTLVKILNRTLELTPGAKVIAGTVLYHERDIYDRQSLPMDIRKRIGIIHQRPVPFPMPILDNVLFGANFHGLLNGMSPREYAEFYLDKVGLLEEIKDRLGDPASKLSGGQQQRLCLARTLANQPEIILMDEPCSAIDPVSTQRIEALISELKKEYAIIVVTHNMNQARRISDQAVFIFGGRIIEAGDTAQLFKEPKTELAQSFVSGLIG